MQALRNPGSDNGRGSETAVTVEWILDLLLIDPTDDLPMECRLVIDGRLPTVDFESPLAID